MTPTEQLFIRACKSGQSHRRLIKLYKTFYWNDPSGGDTSYAVLSILVGICEEYCPMRLSRYIQQSGPSKAWLYQEGTGEYKVQLNILISHIRFTSVLDIKGLSTPARFRNAQ